MSDGEAQLRNVLVMALSTGVSEKKFSAKVAGRVLDHWDEMSDAVDSSLARVEDLEQRVKSKNRLVTQWRRAWFALSREQGWTELQLERALELLPQRERKSFSKEWGA